MGSIVLGFEIHQPLRVKHLPGPSDGVHDGQLTDHYFSSNGLNKFVFDRAAQRCYLPTAKILLEHIDTFKGQQREFKCAFNVSGVWLEQCEKWQPDLLDLFKQLADSGRAEFLGSTYFHSISSLFKNHTEFIEQVKMHDQAIEDLLGVKPQVMLNTEMLYNNLIAKTAENLGFKGIITEGVERVLGWRSPNFVYARGPVGDNDKQLSERIRVLTRNYRLSDDVGYRFSAQHWDQWPLTAEKYAIWLSSTPGPIIPLFIDFETFGEHHPESTGIFYFLKAFPWKTFDWKNLNFVTPSEAIDRHTPSDQIDVHGDATVSWADMERDASAWLGNSMQKMAFDELETLEPIVKINGKVHLRMWRLLQQSDLLYYMCTKHWADGDVHKYFSPFATPHDAFINVVGGLSEIKVRLAKEFAVLDVVNGKGLLTQKKELFDLSDLMKSLDVHVKEPEKITVEPKLEIVETAEAVSETKKPIRKIRVARKTVVEPEVEKIEEEVKPEEEAIMEKPAEEVIIEKPIEELEPRQEIVEAIVEEKPVVEIEEEVKPTEESIVQEETQAEEVIEEPKEVKIEEKKIVKRKIKSKAKAPTPVIEMSAPPISIPTPLSVKTATKVKAKKRKKNKMAEKIATDMPAKAVKEQSPVDFIMSEKVEYPKTYMNMETLSQAADDLRKRLK